MIRIISKQKQSSTAAVWAYVFSGGHHPSPAGTRSQTPCPCADHAALVRPHGNASQGSHHPEVRARHNPKSSSVTNTYPDTPNVNTYMYKHSDTNTTVVTQ